MAQAGPPFLWRRAMRPAPLTVKLGLPLLLPLRSFPLFLLFGVSSRLCPGRFLRVGFNRRLARGGAVDPDCLLRAAPVEPPGPPCPRAARKRRGG